MFNPVWRKPFTGIWKVEAKINSVWLLIPGVLLLSMLLTWVVVRYALHKNMLDIPNQRSSHDEPTPRGGGLAIVLTFLGAILILFLLNGIPKPLFWALFGGGVLVSGVGFLDDHRDVPARWRFSVHIIAAVWAVFWLRESPLGVVDWIGDMLLVASITWLLNLFNFMDGIDGLTVGEAIFVSFAVGLLLLESGFGGASFRLFLLATACGGFACWNWPPAKIFMGDVGSGFLGYILGVFILESAGFGQQYLYVWLILLGVFLVDATFTLVRRILTNQNWVQAHRSHAYQHAATFLKSHKKVTLSVLTINFLWLFPLSACVLIWPDTAPLLLLSAYFPLIWIVVILQAGMKFSRF